jgi:hypothetical protein
MAIQIVAILVGVEPTNIWFRRQSPYPFGHNITKYIYIYTVTRIVFEQICDPHTATIYFWL